MRKRVDFEDLMGFIKTQATAAEIIAELDADDVVECVDVDLVVSKHGTDLLDKFTEEEVIKYFGITVGEGE